MTDTEFEVLDELYFIESFDSLVKTLSMPEAQLKAVLAGLLEKGWIKCLSSATGDLPSDQEGFESQYKKYYYLATKAGLLAHNSR
jgi:hypothetical protein